MVIAIDGPAGSGKSTIARRIAREKGWYFLNTGSFYRAYTLAQLEKGLDPLDRDSVLDTAKNTKITVNDGNIYINGVNAESKLHTPVVDRFASPVSSDPRLRAIVTDEVRALAGTMNIVQREGTRRLSSSRTPNTNSISMLQSRRGRREDSPSRRASHSRKSLTV